MQRIINYTLVKMLTYFPKYFSKLAIGTYFLSLIVVSIMYMQYAMHWYWWVIGAVEVVGFFYFANYLTKVWHDIFTARFTKQLFWWSFGLRLAFMVFMYWFHTTMTGQPFQFAAADTMWYHDMGKFGHQLLSNGEFISRFGVFAYGVALDDIGYPIWLSILYWLFNDSIFVTRVIKCLLGACTCVLIYKVANRNFGEQVARMAAIFCMLMPNLLYYSGCHLKETEMVFILVAFVERADYIIRTRQLMGGQFALTMILAILLFFFRTVLGAAALLSLALALLFTSERVARTSQRWVMLIAMVLIGAYFVAGQILTNVEAYWNLQRSGEQAKNMQWRSERENGNVFAEYASAVVFAPMIFTIPFPTMVETPNQEDQRMMHGANYIKNILSCLCIFGVFMMLFKDGKLRGFLKGPWREHALLLAIMLGYLLILVLSSFAQSERFHMPALPFELIFAAVGVSYVSKQRHKTLYMLWCGVIIVAAISWAWFKLKGRGMI